jgi:hypothetical protein
VTETEYLTLHGVAARGEHLRGIEELKHGLKLPEDGCLSLFTVRDELVGEATVTLNAAGDVLVEGVIPASEVGGLLSAPHLCVAARLEADDAPASLSRILVSGTATDPFQLPYRLTRVPEDLEGFIARAGYDRVWVIDERHDVEVSYDAAAGEWNAAYDEDKSHVEWRHESEARRAELPEAVARGFGFDSWADLVAEASDSGVHVCARSVLEEITRWHHG